MSWTKEFNDRVSKLIHHYNYPCFHREINKVIYGKHYKGIRDQEGKKKHVDNLMRALCKFIDEGYIKTEDELMIELKELQK